jgi:capsular exopolysaccharide synthesis family protein
MTSEFGSNPTLRSYALIVRKRKWWVIAFALVGLIVSLAISFVEPKMYSATAQVLVQPSGQTSALGTTQQPVTQTQVQTMEQLVTSAPVTNAVRRRLGDVPVVTASEVAQTNVIAITADSRVPSQAARIANTYAQAFVNDQQSAVLNNLTSAEGRLRGQIRSIGKQIKQLRGTSGNASELTALINQQAVLREQLTQMQVNNTGTVGGLVLVTPAQTPLSPSSPKPTKNGLLGLAAGLILGLAAAFLRESLDDAVNSKEMAEEFGGATVIAAVPMVNSWKKRNKPLVVSLARPMSPAAEAYRSLRTSLQFARQERDLGIILVTSPAAAEGKTSTLSNLGAMFAQAGERVVLVSCDLRKPRLGEFFGLDEQAGLTTAILGERPLEDLIQPVPGDSNLWMLPSGQPPPNPAELLSGMRAQQIFSTLRELFDLVLIDSPPVLPVTDAVVLSKIVDATVLVVAAGQTSRGDLQRAAEKLGQVNAHITGIVLNETTRQGGYGYGYQYGYGGTYVSDLALPAVPAQLNGNSATAHRASRRAK